MHNVAFLDRKRQFRIRAISLHHRSGPDPPCIVEACIPLRRRHVRRANVRLGSVERSARAAVAVAARRLLPPAEDTVEQGPQGRHARADGGEDELVARPDGEVDVLPAGVEEGKADQLGQAHDADDADAVFSMSASRVVKSRGADLQRAEKKHADYLQAMLGADLERPEPRDRKAEDG